MKMAITWTIVLLGALLHGMKCDPVSNASLSSTVLIPTTSLSSTSPPVHPTITSLSSTSSLVLSSSTSTIINESPVLPTSTSPSSADSTDSTKPTLLTSAGSPDSITSTSTSSASSTDSTKSAQPTLLGSSQATSPVPNILPLTSTTKDSPPQSNANDPQTEHSTTTIQPNIDPTVSNYSPQNSSATVISSVNSDTTDSSTLATTTHNENDKASINQRDTSATTTNPATHSQSTGSQNIQTTEDKTTTASKDLPSDSRRLDDDPMNSSSTPKLLDLKDFDLSTSERGILQETCKALAEKLTGKCSVSLDSNGKQLVATVTINANEVIPKQYYQPQEKKADVSEETIPDTLVAILASCGALVLILCCFAAYCTYHRRSYRKNQQHLTEEMQTVENGYHDNPTLEVMEVVPEMQEKKLALNGEFNDSWIVPIDNLLKDDIPDEEDTHL